MKLTFPCDNGDKKYDSEKDGNVWCLSLAKGGYCDRAAKCMGMVEDAICNCLSQKPMHIVKVQKPAQEELVKEFVTKDIPEFAEAG